MKKWTAVFRGGISGLVFAGLISGCAVAPTPPQVEQTRLEFDQTISLENLRRDGLLIAGLSNAESNVANTAPRDGVVVDNDEQQVIEDQLFDHFSSVLGQEAITRMDELPPAVSGQVEQGILKDFYTAADDSNLSRYVLYYHLAENRIANSTHAGDTEDCYYTSRNVGISIDIYDTQLSKVVFVSEQQSQKKLRNCNEHSAIESDGSFARILMEALVESAIDVVYDETFGTYPKAPSLEVVMAPTMDKVISSIPAVGGI